MQRSEPTEIKLEVEFRQWGPDHWLAIFCNPKTGEQREARTLAEFEQAILDLTRDDARHRHLLF